MVKKKPSPNTIITNKKANFNYQLLDTFEAGMVLFGHEVKSIRNKQCSLDESYVSIKHEEAYLQNCHISPYKFAKSEQKIDPVRNRKLLLNKRELNKLIGASKQKGYSIVPTKIYSNNRNYLKIEIALVTGKKKHDKRESIKERDWQRQQQAILKNNNQCH